MCAVPSDECPDTVADFWELLVFLSSAQELLEWLLTVNSQFCCRVSARVRPGIVIEEIGVFQFEATIYFTSSRPGSPELSVDPVQSSLWFFSSIPKRRQWKGGVLTGRAPSQGFRVLSLRFWVGSMVALSFLHSPFKSSNP